MGVKGASVVTRGEVVKGKRLWRMKRREKGWLICKVRGRGGAVARSRITSGARRTCNPRAALVIGAAQETQEKGKMQLR